MIVKYLESRTHVELLVAGCLGHLGHRFPLDKKQNLLTLDSSSSHLLIPALKIEPARSTTPPCPNTLTKHSPSKVDASAPPSDTHSPTLLNLTVQSCSLPRNPTVKAISDSPNQLSVSVTIVDDHPVVWSCSPSWLRSIRRVSHSCTNGQPQTHLQLPIHFQVRVRFRARRGGWSSLRTNISHRRYSFP